MLYFNNQLVKKILFNDIKNNQSVYPRLVQQINGANQTVGLWASLITLYSTHSWPNNVKRISLYRFSCGMPGAPTGKLLTLDSTMSSSARQSAIQGVELYWGDQVYLQAQAADGYHITSAPDWVAIENNFLTTMNDNKKPKRYYTLNVTSIEFQTLLGEIISQMIPFEATCNFTEGVKNISIDITRGTNSSSVNLTSTGTISDLKYGDIVVFTATAKSGWVVTENIVTWTVGIKYETPFGSTNYPYNFSSGSGSGITMTFNSVSYDALSDRTLYLYCTSNFGSGTTTLSGTLLLHFTIRNLSTGVTSTRDFQIPSGTDNYKNFALSSNEIVLFGTGRATTNTQYSPNLEFKIRYGSTTQSGRQNFYSYEDDVSVTMLNHLNYPTSNSGGSGGGSGGCVQKDTAIWIDTDGTVAAAKDLKKGDTIIGWVDGKMKPVKILQKYHAKDLTKFVRIILDNETLIEITPNHPVLCDGEYKAIRNKDYPVLTIKDKVQTVDGLCKISSIEEVVLEKQAVVNFLTESDNFIAAGTVVASESPDVRGIVISDPFTRADHLISKNLGLDISTSIVPGAAYPGMSVIPRDPTVPIFTPEFEW